ncbi:MAG: hypothetical protein AAGE65_03355 [Planctomycetota bacterium]
MRSAASRIFPSRTLLALLAVSALLTGVRLSVAQQAVNTQVNLQAAQPPPAPSIRFGQTKLLPSEQRFVVRQSGLLPSEIRDLTFQSGSLPSQGIIPGDASLRYPEFTEQFDRIANNTANASIRFGNNLGTTRSFNNNFIGRGPQSVSTLNRAGVVTPNGPTVVTDAPLPAGSTQISGRVADTRITDYRPWTPVPDQSRPIDEARLPQPTLRYTPASLGQFTPSRAR